MLIRVKKCGKLATAVWNKKKVVDNINFKIEKLLEFLGLEGRDEKGGFYLKFGILFPSNYLTHTHTQVR